ncbi:UDP-N-acetylglucosamine--N-acetylmuramyl-(pentapeptide) pyrophosphoryl-undecaprenol N-acetylglucosamine transferase [Candidatus Peregrinibacteria bacterium]|nr:MAG: UDP-N-acetylglucosamine--N-acetylmuramyl-(pentapeptide) pyrophosphoryl-undecaprenol N-acetylglucosamine transferase [Candidatus Peregrinibacteria bacterium]
MHGGSQKPVILIWGGSQGAQQINEQVEKEFDELVERFQVIHITGAQKPVRRQHANYVQYDYVNDDLKHLYAITSLAISRAGANSLFELAYLEIPMILMPLQNADQQANATYFVENGAARLYHPTQSLSHQIEDFLKNPRILSEVKKSLKTLATPSAAKEIANLIQDKY